MNEEQILHLIENHAVPHPTRAIELVETHISWVLLGDAYVYKIKKPLKLSFLDFSTLPKRHFYCQQEILLNRRLAPSMYLKVLPIYESSGGARIGGKKARIIDYAVLMKRMDPSRQMDLLLENDKVDLSMIHALADKIAAFHLSALKIREGEDWKTLYDEFADIQSVQEFMKEHFGIKTQELMIASRKWAYEYLRDNKEYLLQRLDRGCVVDGHGDLHCRNIFLLKEPVIFDCIEFNEDFRKLDVLSEVAFLAMDLERLGRNELSQALCDRYFIIVPCLESEPDSQLFLFYKLYRANVRIKVHALRAMEPDVDTEGVHQEKVLIKQYLKVFETYFKALSGR